MKKTLIFVLVLGLVVVSLASTAPVMAAEVNRGGPGNGGGTPGGSGSGGHGQQGTAGTGTGIPLDQNIELNGLLDEYIHANLAAALGISPDVLTARLDVGETISQIALSLGFDPALVSDMLLQARADALAQAVAEGLITQEQADWLAARGSQAPASGYGDGICDGDCLSTDAFQSLMAQGRKGFNK